MKLFSLTRLCDPTFDVRIDDGERSAAASQDHCMECRQAEFGSESLLRLLP